MQGGFSSLAGSRGAVDWRLGVGAGSWHVLDRGVPDSPSGDHSSLRKRAAMHPQPVNTLDPMTAWRSVARSNLAVVAIFSVVVNLFLLTLPIYLFQISDRVLTSRSLDTLLMLSVVALGFIAVLSMLDILRRQVLGRLATQMEALLGGPVLASIVNNARAGEGGNVQALRSLQQVRNFISSPVMLLLIDGPLAPIYFAVIFLIHRDLGFIALASALVLLLDRAFSTRRRRPIRSSRASLHASKADAAAESLARNSQVINAMGMLDESIRHWGAAAGASPDGSKRRS